MEKMFTYSENTFTPLDPSPEEISLIDIAVGLSRVPRFVGHTHHFFSVAEHSILVSQLANNERMAMLGLFHDASEAYISDIPSPVKKALKPAVADIEDRIMSTILNKFGINHPTPEEKIELKKLDTLAFQLEDSFLRNYAWTTIRGITPRGEDTAAELGYPNLKLPLMGQDQAALAFMREYEILKRKLK